MFNTKVPDSNMIIESLLVNLNKKKFVYIDAYHTRLKILALIMIIPLFYSTVSIQPIIPIGFYLIIYTKWQIEIFK